MKLLVFLLLILLTGFYVGWPAYSGYEIRTALESQNAEALAGKIDFPSVKESLRPAATAEAERAMNEALQKAGGGAGALGADIAKKVLPKLVDSSLNVIVTPENIIRLYTERAELREAVSRMVRDELGRSGGIAGLGALLGRDEGGKQGGLAGALDAIGKAGGIDLSKVVKTRPPVTTPAPVTTASPVRTVGAPAQSAGAPEPEKGYGISNIKHVGLSGPLSVELGVARDSAATEPDITAEMSFTGTDWKLTALRPRVKTE